MFKQQKKEKHYQNIVSGERKGEEDLQVHSKIQLEFKNCMCRNNKLRTVQFSSTPPLNDTECF